MSNENDAVQNERLVIVDEVAFVMPPIYDPNDPELRELLEENQGQFGQVRVAGEEHPSSDENQRLKD